MTPARARTRRRLAGLALSLGVHAGLLLAFMSVTPGLLTFPRPPAPPEPTFKLELARQAAASRAASAAPRRASAAAPSPLPALSPRPVLRPSEAPTRRPRPQSPAALTARVAEPAAAAPGAPDGRWRVYGEGGNAAGAARALARGTLGCGDAGYLHLAADEREHCNAEYVRGMRTLRVDAIPAGKRAYYDAVVASIENARGLPAAAPNARPLTRSHGLDATVGYHCHIAFGPGAARANKDAGVRLAMPPCPLRPPLSVLTAETRAPSPPTLAEQEADAHAAAKPDPVAAPR